MRKVIGRVEKCVDTCSATQELICVEEAVARVCEAASASCGARVKNSTEREEQLLCPPWRQNAALASTWMLRAWGNKTDMRVAKLLF